MKLGRFIVETHCHGQRHAARIQQHDDDADYETIAEKMHMAVQADKADDDDDVIVYDNSDRLLYDMDTYGVDMCILLPGFGMNNELNQQIIDKHPDKFVAAAYPIETKKRHLRGEEEWTWDAAMEELDHWLQQDGFKMTGEFIPRHPDQEALMSWPDRREEIRHTFDVAADHGVPVRWHTGTGTSGYSTGKHPWPDMNDPTYAGELKAEYPEVPIIFEHGGHNAGWREHNVDRCCQVAASWDDVYLEVGNYWAELLKKPYHDPNVGPEQMIWGGDWGASLPQVSRPGQYPPFYWDQVNDRGLPAHQCDYWGASFRQHLKFALDQDIEQDKLNLILGGNIVRLLDLDVPHTRLFENYLQT